MFTVNFEYSNSHCWNTGIGEPAVVQSMHEAMDLATAHLNHPTSNCQTRVRIRDDAGRLVRERTGANA